MISYNGMKSERQTSNNALPAGAYIVEILNVQTADVKTGKQLVVSFDVCEGEYINFFRNDYKSNSSQNKKWRGVYRLGIPVEGSEYFEIQKRVFNNFLWAIEESNPGYVFDGEEKRLVGKHFGALFRNKEWEYNGKTGWTSECASVTSVPCIESGDYKLPADKPLKKEDAPVSTASNSVYAAAVIGDVT